MMPLVLASVSEIRATLLRNAGVAFETVPARIDEETIRAALEAEGAKPRDVADALAEFKARKIARSGPMRWSSDVIRCWNAKGGSMASQKRVMQRKHSCWSFGEGGTGFFRQPWYMKPLRPSGDRSERSG